MIKIDWHETLATLVHENFDALRDEYLEMIYRVGRAPFRGKTVIEHFQSNSVSLWWMSLTSEKCEFKQPEIYDTLKIRAFEKFFLHSHTEDYEVLNCPVRFHSFFEKIARALNKKIQFQKSIPIKLSLRAHTPPLIRAGFYFCKWWFKRWWVVKLKRLARKPLQSQPIFFTYMPLFDLELAKKERRFRSAYWNTLHDYLDQKKIDANWIWFFEPIEQQFPMYVDLANEISKHRPENPIYFLEDFISPWGIAKIWFQYFLVRFKYLGFTRLRNHFAFKNSFWNSFELHQPNCDASFAGAALMSSLIYLEAFRNIIRTSQSAPWAMYLWENQPWEMGLLQLWKNLIPQIPIYGYQHTIVIPTDFRNFCHPKEFQGNPKLHHPIPNQILCNSELSFELLKKSGYPSEKLNQVEALRYFYLKGHYQSRKLVSFQNQVLVVLGCTDSDIRQQIELMIAFRKKNNTIHFILKPHPFHFIDSLIEEYGLQGIEVFKGPMAEALFKAEMVFCTHSTATIIEAAWLGLPQLICAPVDRLNNCIFFGKPGIPFVHNLEEFSYYLNHPTKIEISEHFYSLAEGLPLFETLALKH